MKTLKIKNKKITNNLGNIIVKSYKNAISLSNKYKWNKNDIIERKEQLLVELNGVIKNVELYCIYVDSGSNDYIYFIKY